MSQDRAISRRGFIHRAGAICTGLLFLAIKPSWAASNERVICRACNAQIKPSAADEVVCCPNCGREWWTGGFALDSALSHRFPYHQPATSEPRWDYAQVPFPNFEMLEKSDKPVLSLKSITFSGRGAV
jgi:hypothetical protein